MIGIRLALALCLLGSWTATAEEEAPAPGAQVATPAPPDSAPAEEEAGALVIFVFEGGSGRPLGGAILQVDGRPHAADDDGALHVSLPPGAHRLALPGLGTGSAPAEVPVIAGGETEVRVTADPAGGAPWVEVEAPAGGSSATGELEAIPPGRVEGRVVDARGQPIPGARILVRGSGAEARADDGGRFSLELAPGRWDLSALRAGYATQSVTGVEVASGERAEVLVELVEAGVELATVRVTAPRVEGSALELLEERRETSAVADVVGAEQMARAGDSSAAAALRRVTGLTLVGGRYVYVRGLGERYSSALLGGSTLPSPEPERRVVPLDLFTANLLESLVVQKTYSPDLPGEFGGGTILLRTRGYPSEATTSASVSLGYAHGATLATGMRAAPGPTDWLGYDGGSRDPSLPLQAATEGGQVVPQDQFSSGGFTPEELEALGESVPNRWAFSPWRLPPNLGLTASRGDSRPLGSGEGGYLASLTFSEDLDLDRYWRADYVLGAGGALEENWRYDFEDLTQRARLGAILTLGADFGDAATLKLTTLYSHSAEALSRSYTGVDPEGVTLRVHRSRWVEQRLSLAQITGSHVLPGPRSLGLSWRYTASVATRDEPDRRDWRYDLETGDPADPADDRWLFSALPDNNELFYSALRDVGHDLGADLEIPFTWRGDLEGSLKLGGAAVLKSRQGDGRRFKFFDKSGAGAEELLTDDVRALPMDELMTPAYIDPRGYQLLEVTRSTDSYRARQDIEAAYALTELPLAASTHLSGGLRLERSAQAVTSFELFSTSPQEVKAELTTLDLLPAATLTQQLGEDSQLRLGYGRTLSRPDFRELSELEFNDVAGDFVIKGSTELDRVRIDNLDARWEVYPGEGESISIAAFYKRFQDPVEMVIIAGAEPVMTFRNAERARNLGVELEAMTRLDRLAAPLADVFVAGNLSLIRSRIELDEADAGIQTSTVRPLQGQSPWVINAQLGWDDPDRGGAVTLLLNAFGPRIASVGASGAPDLYELPSPQLDLVASQRLGHGLKLGFKGTNLLNAPVRRSQGGVETLRFKDGWTATLSLGWSG